MKSAAELAGIRRAQAAAHAGLAAAAGCFARAVPDADRLTVDGEVLTSETVRAALRDACLEAGAPAPPDMTVSSVWNGGGHDPGSGPLPANLPIIVDLWPRDEETGCWADCMRTFLVGEAPEGAQNAAGSHGRPSRRRARVRPGVKGSEVYAAAADVIEAEGYRSQRTENGSVPDDGFQASLGHGLGLAVHEPPAIGLAGHDPLVAGDVITLEPGIFTPGLGEVCFEDMLLVTEDGAETLTDFPTTSTLAVPARRGSSKAEPAGPRAANAAPVSKLRRAKRSPGDPPTSRARSEHERQSAPSAREVGGSEGKLRGRPPPPVEPRSGPWHRTGSESNAGRAQTRPESSMTDRARLRQDRAHGD